MIYPAIKTRAPDSDDPMLLEPVAPDRAACGVCTCRCPRSMSDRQPNLLRIYTDQHCADVLGCAGNDIVVTPHLDRLAGEGVRFDHAWTETPICQPARASMLTGRYPNDHGVIGNFAGDSKPEWDTFPRRLQQAGYTTSSIGETHFSSWPMAAEPDTPPPTDEWIGSFGFDHVVEEFDKYIHVGDWETPYMRFLRDHDALELYQSVIAANFRLGDRHWKGVTSPCHRRSTSPASWPMKHKDGSAGPSQRNTPTSGQATPPSCARTHTASC